MLNGRVYPAFSSRAASQSRRTAVLVRNAVITQAEARTLYQSSEARAKAWVALEEKDAATRPKVKVTLTKAKVALGEAWKLLGPCPELGRVVEVAPYMKTTDGETWTFEGTVRHGSFPVTAVLRRLDKSYWMDGPSGILEIPKDKGPNDTVELTLTL